MAEKTVSVEDLVRATEHPPVSHELTTTPN